MPKSSADRPSRAAIIVAAGIGQRAGGDVPKQYRRVAGKTVLERTHVALKTFGFDRMVIVTAPNDSWIDDLDLPRVERVDGGATRTESVRNGLLSLQSDPPEHVYIHDAARPFVSNTLLQRLSDALLSAEATAPALPIADAVKQIAGDEVVGAVDRDNLRRVQTPQAFDYDALMEAYAASDGSFHDDIEIAIAHELKTKLVEGDENNFKITYPSDFEKAESMLAHFGQVRVGQGYDVHQIGEGDGVWIGGVRIECDFSLIGHSDADVGLHAITDALLGACAQGDIGDHFPPSDPQWKGASSDRFLAHAVALCAGSVQNIDLTIVCERPKIKPHRLDMRRRIAEICDIEIDRVSVKATTTEGLGFEGRGEGISAQAVVTVAL